MADEPITVTVFRPPKRIDLRCRDAIVHVHPFAQSRGEAVPQRTQMQKLNFFRKVTRHGLDVTDIDDLCASSLCVCCE